jgi:hypothetical protein
VLLFYWGKYEVRKKWISDFMANSEDPKCKVNIGLYKSRKERENE